MSCNHLVDTVVPLCPLCHHITKSLDSGSVLGLQLTSRLSLSLQSRTVVGLLTISHCGHLTFRREMRTVSHCTMDSYLCALSPRHLHTVLHAGVSIRGLCTVPREERKKSLAARGATCITAPRLARATCINAGCMSILSTEVHCMLMDLFVCLYFWYRSIRFSSQFRYIQLCKIRQPTSAGVFS